MIDIKIAGLNVFFALDNKNKFSPGFVSFKMGNDLRKFTKVNFFKLFGKFSPN